ncbi:hypothetical protein PSI15_10080 [Xenorhabdus sp. PR6a]|uniref:hypothetical protein n=1 Tax=Xenorhabdus sp. PR6a TaxID=3025877 RepID=UPI002358CAE5|nr:hypothetical protein [Xenorhabdus sp. PR6a]MDC9581908.1 hypothetical protein [Xenorhabdus sp. PR6a]
MELKKVEPIITDKIREKAKLMIMSSIFAPFISTATNLELARAIAIEYGDRPNRRLRDVAKGIIGKYPLDELNCLLKDLATSTNTDKAYLNILSYRDSFISSAEKRIALMNEYIGGDLDELMEQGVPVEELTQKVAEFRKVFAQRKAA